MSTRIEVAEHEPLVVLIPLDDGRRVNLQNLEAGKLVLIDRYGEKRTIDLNDPACPGCLDVLDAARGELAFRPGVAGCFQRERSPYRGYLLLWFAGQKYRYPNVRRYIWFEIFEDDE